MILGRHNFRLMSVSNTHPSRSTTRPRRCRGLSQQGARLPNGFRVIPRGPHLQYEEATIARRRYGPENIQIIDLPRTRLMATGYVGNVKVADFGKVFRYTGYEIPLTDLCMVNVVDEADTRTPYFIDHSEAFLIRPQVVTLVIDEEVQVLDIQGHPCLLTEGSSGAEGLHAILVLAGARKILQFASHLHE